MKHVSRRKLLVGASAGAAVVALAAVPAYEAISNSQTKKLTANPAGPVMVYVTDAAAGEVVVLVGSKYITRHDPELVSRLLQAAQ